MRATELEGGAAPFPGAGARLPELEPGAVAGWWRGGATTGR